MKKKISNYILLSAIIILSSGCITNTEDLSINGGNLPEDVSYSNSIQPIFNQSCGGSGCHTNGGSQNGVNLSSYSTALNSVGSNYGTNVIIKESPDESPLVDKIEPNPEIGSRMPLSGGYLSRDQIQLIRVWIQEGARDN